MQENNKVKSVPLLIYENEMQHKTNIIKGLLILLGISFLILGISIYLFMSFINAHDIASYAQDGNGINNINTGEQGDVVNESTIKDDN